MYISNHEKKGRELINDNFLRHITKMIATAKRNEMAVLMAATIIAAGTSIAPFLGAEAQIAIKENGGGLVDQ